MYDGRKISYEFALVWMNAVRNCSTFKVQSWIWDYAPVPIFILVLPQSAGVEDYSEDWKRVGAWTINKPIPLIPFPGRGEINMITAGTPMHIYNFH
jgi:hypothetical protein